MSQVSTPKASPIVVRGPRVTVRHDELRPQQQRIALATILGPTLGTVAATWIAALRGFSALDFGMLITGIVLGQMFLEVGFHRLLAHKAFDTYPWVRTLLAIGGSMTGQGRVTHWVANHRRHHIHSDTPHDPHSPHVRARRDGTYADGGEGLGLVKGLVHAQWGHMVTDDVPNCTLFARDLGADPALRWVNQHYAAILWTGLLLPALTGFAITGTAWGLVSGFLWGGLARMFVVQNVTWSVASISHRFGYAPFDTGDKSKNLLLTAIPSFGSGYQNNHHAFPYSAYLGLRWWEIDFAAMAIRLLSVFRLAWNLKRPSEHECNSKLLQPPAARKP